MIRSELVQIIADDNPHLYQRDVERIVNTVFNEITEALAKGDRVELRGFGAFSVKRRDAEWPKPEQENRLRWKAKLYPFSKQVNFLEIVLTEELRKNAFSTHLFLIFLAIILVVISLANSENVSLYLLPTDLSSLWEPLFLLIYLYF